jgi:hypothetical protein
MGGRPPANTRTAPADEGTGLTKAPPRRRTSNRSEACVLMALGLILIGFWCLVVTLQVQTTEAYLNGDEQTTNVMQAQWMVWLQIPKMMFGANVPGPDISSNDAQGDIVASGIEIFFIGLIIGYEIAMHTSTKFGKLIGGVIRFISFLVCIFDFYSDVTYGSVSMMTHTIFAIFCSLTVAFALTWGLAMLEAGYKRL